MEEARAHIAVLDLIKSKDMFKLTLGFKATLPIDKVYSILGLVDERHTPLFHPRFGASDSNGVNRVMDPRTGFKDLVGTMKAIPEILAAMKGRSSSRRAKAIVALGTTATLRYIKLLSRDLETTMRKLGHLKKDLADLHEERMQPDYTEKSTAHLVYSYVARDLVKQNDALAFIAYAGIAYPRHPELAKLPSWVPDWSQNITVYVFPWCKYDKPTTTDENSERDQKQDAAFKDGGSKLLFVKASMIGTITCSTILSRDCDAARLGTQEEVEMDFGQISSSFKTALKSAQENLIAQYQSMDDLKQAFYSTLTATSSTGGNSATSRMRDWTLGLSADCPIAAALVLWRSKGFPNHVQRPDGTPGLRDELASSAAKYSSIRRTSSSVESKLAHLIRADVVPSYSQYRVRRSIPKEQQFSSILDADDDAGALSGYAQYVDYTIGRSFIITDTEMMGLSPAATQEGDIVVEVRSIGRIVWLTLRPDAAEEDQKSEACKASTESKERDDRQPSSSKTYQLVGEAYINRPINDPLITEDLQWFKLS